MFLFFALSPFCPKFLSVPRQTTPPFPPRLFFEYLSSCGRILPALAHRWSQIKKARRRFMQLGNEKDPLLVFFFSAVHFVSLFSTSGSFDSCRKCSSPTNVFSEAGFYKSVCPSVCLSLFLSCLSVVKSNFWWMQ